MDVFQRINQIYQTNFARIVEEEILTYLKGQNMIKLSTGVEVSEETVISALKKAGISVESKYVFKAGDVAYNEINGKSHSSDDWRFIVNIDGKLCSICAPGTLQGWEQKYFERNNYVYAGRQSDLLSVTK